MFVNLGVLSVLTLGGGREGAPWLILLAQDHASVPLCCVAFLGCHIAAVLLQYCCSTDTTTATVLLQYWSSTDPSTGPVLPQY